MSEIIVDDEQILPNGQEATALSYRKYAAAERAAATSEPLPNRKAMHLRSADVWDDRAKLIEDMLGRKRTNEAHKPAGAAAREADRKAGWPRGDAAA